MIRTYELKLYPNKAQAATLAAWMGKCCWIYNRALDMRRKAYTRRKHTMNYQSQSLWLTGIRKRVKSVRDVPLEFERDALRRVSRGFDGFFRRVASGSKAGFPRFRSSKRYNSLECLDAKTYVRGNRIRVPVMGSIRCRCQSIPAGTQKALRIFRRPGGWYAQILVCSTDLPSVAAEGRLAAGVDIGLADFATISDGSAIDNPRWGKRAAAKVTALQRRVSRRTKGSNRRARAVIALAITCERVAVQRRNFCHQHSTALVRKYSLIAVEKLNVAGMARSRFAKSILDAAWSTFTTQLVAKAEYAGCQVVFVNARGTSQECPNCGAIKPKKLSERIHSCACGLVCQRDHAAAQVILARALAGKRGESRVEGVRRDHQQCAVEEAAPANRVGDQSPLPIDAPASSLKPEI